MVAAGGPRYEYKYYGTAIQIPIVFIEDIFGFQLSTRQIYLIRHFYNFLICFIGYICFFLFYRGYFVATSLPFWCSINIMLSKVFCKSVL